MTTLTDFCTTDNQRTIIQHHLEGLSSRKIAEKLGRPEGYGSTVRKVIQQIKAIAEDRGFDPEHHRNHVVPSKHIVSGYSDMVKYPEDDPLGRIVGWIKTNRKLAAQVNDARTLVEAMSLDLPAIKPVKFMGNVKEDRHFSVLAVGDPHIGLRTWAAEVGVDWDIPIARRVYEKVLRRLFARTPDTETLVLFNSGDFFHADNIAGETTRSGHKLDLDGRPGYWLEAGVQILMMMIEMGLSKYQHVHLVNTPGNHDDILGMALGIFAQQLYRDESRFTCQAGMNPFQYYERGTVGLGFAHGHTCKLGSLPGKMAADMPEMWGRTRYRHWLTGHVHHNQWIQFKEHPGCTVESVGIIPPKDSHSHGGGYGAGRGTQLLVLDSEGGYMPDRFMEPVLATD